MWDIKSQKQAFLLSSLKKNKRIAAKSINLWGYLKKIE
jgi:hypothetical protein